MGILQAGEEIHLLAVASVWEKIPAYITPSYILERHSPADQTQVKKYLEKLKFFLVLFCFFIRFIKFEGKDDMRALS